MKYCEECGAQLEDDMRFCDECGTPVSDYEEVQEVKETGAQVQSVTEQKVITQSVVSTESQQTNYSEEPRPTLRNTGKKAPKKGGLIAAVVGVLLVAVVVIGIVFLGKGDEGKTPEPENKTQETVKQDNEDQALAKQEDETPGDSGQKEQTETKVTEAVVADKKEESDVNEDAYPLLEEFIDVVCSYSDPPPFEGDLLDAYFKLEYDSWVSGEGYTNIVIGEDGHLKIKKDYLFDGMPYGAYLFGGQTDTMEYAFIVAKENTKYWSEFYFRVGSEEYNVELNTPQEGIVIGETTVVSGVVDEYSGEWIEILFAPHSDGECWFYLEDYYGGSSTLILNTYIPADSITQGTFDNYQEYDSFLYE